MTSRDEMAWLHELRNAVNAACVALDVAKRSLDASEPARARQFIAHAEDACSRSRELLSRPNQPPPATEPSTGSPAPPA